MATFTVTSIERQAAAVVHREVPIETLPAVFDRAFGEVMRVAHAQGVAITGPPFGFYPRAPTDTVEVAAGFPVSGPVAPDGDVIPFELPGGRAATGIHTGPYETLETSYRELADWAEVQGHTLAGPMWESYLTDPQDEPDPSGWQTRITCPLA